MINIFYDHDRGHVRSLDQRPVPDEQPRPAVTNPRISI